MTKYSHLSYEDRKNIEDGLNDNKSINQIAKELNRNHSTVLREIDRNRKYSEPSNWNNYKINHPGLNINNNPINIIIIPLTKVHNLLYLFVIPVACRVIIEIVNTTKSSII